MTRSTASLLALALAAAGCSSRSAGPVDSAVLISIDTCRADALGCYGGRPETTPNLDRLAAQGAVFENTISPVPITLPAHCSLMTGLDPNRHGVHYNLGHLLHPDVDTLAEQAARHGLATGAFVSSIVLDRRWGLDQGFADYQDDLSGRPQNLFGAERPGAETVDLAAHWLRTHRRERFFLFVHLYEPHEPYRPPPEVAARFPDSPYLGEVATADACVGRLLEVLRELDLDDSTLVAAVGDHGEMLGEHGEDGHTYFIYQSALRVPFIVRPPSRAKAARIQRLVGLIDVAPTLAGLLGLPPLAGADGVDLSPLVRGADVKAPPRQLVCESLTPTRYGANPLHGLVGERWKLIRTTRPELYDLTRDPSESADLAAGEPGIVAEQQRLLSERLRASAANAAGAAAPPVDTDTARRLAALGYAPSPLDASMGLDPAAADPKDLIAVHVAHTRALQLIVDGEFAAAEPLSRQVLAALPASWEAQLTMGKVAVGLGRWAEAVPLFERSLELKPAQYEALRGIGLAYAGLGDAERAVACLRRALPLDPEPPLAAVDLACALLDQGSDREAGLLLAQAARAASHRPGANREIARRLEECGHPDQAAAVLANPHATAQVLGDRDRAVMP
jgi:arylsulfatase A-like enzyme/Tfp pilus assembly protein PilF